MPIHNNIYCRRRRFRHKNKKKPVEKNNIFYYYNFWSVCVCVFFSPPSLNTQVIRVFFFFFLSNTCTEWAVGRWTIGEKKKKPPHNLRRYIFDHTRFVTRIIIMHPYVHYSGCTNLKWRSSVIKIVTFSPYNS